MRSSINAIVLLLALEGVAWGAGVGPGVSPGVGGLQAVGNLVPHAPPLTNPPGGGNNYAPIDSPVFTTALTLPKNVTCTGSQVLSAVQANLTPSCTTPAGTGAPLTNPVGGQNNYAPIAGPTFTGTLTLPTAVTCTGGLVLSGFAANLVPSCTSLPVAGAPLTNPTGGQNNYAPIAGPTFTGVLTAPTASLLGPSPRLYLQDTTNSGEGIFFNSATGVLRWGMTTGGGTGSQGNWAVQDAVTGVYPLVIGPGPVNGVSVTTPMTATSTLDLTYTAASSVFLGGNTTSPGASLTSIGSDNMNVASGAHYSTSGWTADAANAAFTAWGGGNTRFFGNTGLTAGSTYGPTEVATITPNGTYARTFIGNATPSIGGGGSLGAGSNSFAGEIINVAASNNVLTTGVTCPHGVIATFQDASFPIGAITLSGRSATGIAFSATAGHNIDYIASCY